MEVGRLKLVLCDGDGKAGIGGVDFVYGEREREKMGWKRKSLREKGN